MRASAFRNLIILLFAAGAATTVKAQDASRIYIEQTGWAVGYDVGTTDLWGNVGTKSPIEHYLNGKYFDKVCFMGGMFGRYTIHPAIAVKLAMDYGTFYATDVWNQRLADKATSQGDDAYQRYARHQDAKPDIFESSAVMELTPFRLNPESKMAHRKGQIYFGAGLAVFHFTPKSSVGNTGTFVNTYDLHIAGDGFGGAYPAKYSLWQLSIPLVVGYRWDVGQHLNIGFALDFRKTFTGYLDGVTGNYIDPKEYALHLSPGDAAIAAAIQDKGYLYKLEQPNVPGNLRGDPSTKDAYSTISFNIYYKVFARSKEWWKQH